jgi:hypothetical protein
MGLKEILTVPPTINSFDLGSLIARKTAIFVESALHAVPPFCDANVTITFPPF